MSWIYIRATNQRNRDNSRIAPLIKQWDALKRLRIHYAKQQNEYSLKQIECFLVRIERKVSQELDGQS
jgi:hypothetical protein